MYFETRLLAAAGYSDLGMMRESMAELNAIDDFFQDRPEVLQLRLQNFMQRRRWNQALRISRKLCQIAPQCSTGFLHAGFCLHELGRTAEAKKILMRGPPALLNDPIYHYNMGCYNALLGNTHDAQTHLQTSFAMDETFRELARKDPDLQPFQDLV